MSYIHYKFRNNSKHDTIQFDGSYISVGEIKQAIINQKKIGRTTDFSLQIINAQTSEEYKDDNQLIPRNADVTVKRVPTGHKVSKSQLAQQSGSLDMYKMKTMKPITISTRETDLSKIEGSEEEKLRILMAQQSAAYEPTQYMNKKMSRLDEEIPLNYICHRCGQPGHLIKNCPTNGDPAYEHRRPNQSRRMNLTLKKAEKKPEKTPEEKRQEEQKRQEVQDKVELIKQSVLVNFPPEYKCPICNNLMVDASISVCCGQSFCDECIREKLLDDPHCPMCMKEVYAAELVQNMSTRSSIRKYKKDRHDEISKLYTEAHNQKLQSPRPEAVNPAPQAPPNPAPAIAKLSISAIPTRNTVTQVQAKPDVTLPPPVLEVKPEVSRVTSSASSAVTSGSSMTTTTTTAPSLPPGPLPTTLPPPPVAILPPKAEEDKEGRSNGKDNSDTAPEVVAVKEVPPAIPAKVLPQLPTFPPISGHGLPPMLPVPAIPRPMPPALGALPGPLPMLPGQLPLPPVQPPGLLPPPLPIPEHRNTEGILNQEEFYAIQNELRKLQRRRRSSSRSPRRRSYSPSSREHSGSPRHRSGSYHRKRKFDRPPYDRSGRLSSGRHGGDRENLRASVYSRLRGGSTLRTKSLARRVRSHGESGGRVFSRHRASDEKSGRDGDRRRVFKDEGNRRTPDEDEENAPPDAHDDEEDYESGDGPEKGKDVGRKKREEMEGDDDDEEEEETRGIKKDRSRKKKHKKHKKKKHHRSEEKGGGDVKPLTGYSESESTDETGSQRSGTRKTSLPGPILPQKKASPSPSRSPPVGGEKEGCKTPVMTSRGAACTTPLYNGADDNEDAISLKAEISDRNNSAGSSDESSPESEEQTSGSRSNLEELRKAYRQKEKEIRELKKEQAAAKAKRKAKKHKKRKKEEKVAKKKKKKSKDGDEERRQSRKRSYEEAMEVDEELSKTSSKQTSSKRSRSSKRSKMENGKDDVKFKINITPIKNMSKPLEVLDKVRKNDAARRVHINVSEGKQRASEKSHRKSHKISKHSGGTN